MRKRKKVEELLKVRVPLDPWPFHIEYVFGDEKQALSYAAKELDATPAELVASKSADLEGACYFSEGMAPIIWMPTIPDTDHKIGVLAHETLHAVVQMAEHVNMDINKHTQEAFCYVMQHCVKTALTESFKIMSMRQEKLVVDVVADA